MTGIKARSAKLVYTPNADRIERWQIYRIYSSWSVLFGIGLSSYPSVPGGREVQLIVISKKPREALNRAFAGPVRDDEITVEEAI